MIIDFHTHAFPDKIAGKTMEILSTKGNIINHTDGTLTGLEQSMKESNIDISVVLPIVTKKEQFNTINRCAVQINEKENFFSFGSMHPMVTNKEEEINEIKNMQLPGIKLHPEYQQSYVDDLDTVKLVDSAISKGLHVLFHAGKDVGYSDPVHCTPMRACNLLKQLGDYENAEGKIIFAHMGGYLLWDEVLEHLAGEPVYFDLAVTLGQVEDELFYQIMDKHGEDKILFGSDSPWDVQKRAVEYFKKMNLSSKTKEKIFCENAEKLLGIS